ncbi:MAG: hypothetical protein A2W21_12480 [Betaproteobacteria bacterium RBG_16_66_20]|nr:MAG: hypothetical protein A2W21_12480 [Betaproteobacteria bacterium RBG_16_66_20]
MLCEGSAIGAIMLARENAGEFSAKQVALLKTFADQAVIAIENVRLFNETKEALERQTATAEILKVISGSPTDIAPVFSAILEKATRLSGAPLALLWMYEQGNAFRAAAAHGTRPEYYEWASSQPHDINPPFFRPEGPWRAKQFPDVRDSEAYRRGDPLWTKTADLEGVRTLLSVPMLREQQLVGSIAVYRREVRPFTDKQIELVQTFADQAVIAIENVRLFNETKEALERLTATSEVLKVISRSPTDVQPVFDTIAERAAVLCGARFCTLSRFDGEAIHMAAIHGATPEGAEAIRAAYPMKPGSGTLAARVIRDRKPLHIADVQADPDYDSKDAAAAVGFRSVLGVPMMRDGHLAGAIVIAREQAGLFPEDQVNLLATFADQAAIAIENVRLFHEIEEKGRQLEVASRHKSDFLASMSHELRTPLNAILGFNEMIIGQVYGEVPADMQEPLADIQTSGKHLLRLINNVLDLAKIEAGRMELSLQDYSVHDTVESVRSTLRPLAAEKGLEFLASVPNDLPLAYGDGGRIAQCLMNLAGNSLKFTKAGKVEISVETRDDLLVYKVSDTGMGIPPDKIGSLFTEFKQTDATIASEYGGTGLGLSISRKFVEMHGGQIWVESELGKGSTFIFEVPLRAKTA